MGGVAAGGVLEGPIWTRWVHAEEEFNSLSEAGKTEICHLQSRFPRIYAPRSATATTAATAAPAPTTERLAEEDAAAVAAAVDDTSAAQACWTHLGSPTPVAGYCTPATRYSESTGGPLFHHNSHGGITF